jgi:hypothetical protein
MAPHLQPSELRRNEVAMQDDEYGLRCAQWEVLDGGLPDHVAMLSHIIHAINGGVWLSGLAVGQSQHYHRVSARSATHARIRLNTSNAKHVRLACPVT